MRVAVLADIGQPVYHVGDEAIGHAATEQLSARGAEIVLLTRNLAHTRRYHGNVEAALTLQFPWPPQDAERYLGEIRQVLAGKPYVLPRVDQIHRFQKTIASVDALLIAGGGNLNSSYRWLMYERIAAALTASSLGKPVVLSGQTLGPALIEHDRGLAAELLRLCALVSLRDQASVRLARELAPEHPAICAGLDDASYWPTRSRAPDAANKPVAAEPGLVVATFSPGTGPIDHRQAVTGIATLLDTLASSANLRVDLVPHMSTPGKQDQDVDFNAQIVASSKSGRLHCVPLANAREAALTVAKAELVITSRFHPVVFAAHHAVPIFGLVPDHYADVRISGALTNVGLDGWAVPLSAVLTPMATEALAAVWQARGEVTTHLRAAAQSLRAGNQQRWDDIVAGLSGQPVRPTGLSSPAMLAAPPQVVAARDTFRHVLDLTGAVEQERLEADRARGRIAELEASAAARTMVGGCRRQIRHLRAALRWWFGPRIGRSS